MMKMELAVLKKYLKQITFTMLIVIVCLVVGMGSLTSVPGMAFLTVTFSVSMSASRMTTRTAGGRIAWSCP